MEQGSQNSQASAEEASMEAATVKRKAPSVMEKDPKNLFLRGKTNTGSWSREKQTQSASYLICIF
jgi:hypothetical protein